jgi:hypothetical protein
MMVVVGLGRGIGRQEEYVIERMIERKSEGHTVGMLRDEQKI